ncbi:MAG: hypothetical protein OEW60_03735 [Thiovulaceae bacterium]|nr:hypothetical protein [Sulfurimonadaceae bacterium]
MTITLPTLQKINRKTINLYNDLSIKSHRTVFNIADDDDLHEWWEYHLEHMDLCQNEKIVHFIETSYRLLTEVSAKKKNLEKLKKWNFDIVFEDAVSVGYWTFRSHRIAKYLALHKESIQEFDYLIDDKKVSFRLPLRILEVPTSKNEKTVVSIKEKSRYSDERNLEVYDTFALDDIQTVKEIIDDLLDHIIYLEEKGFDSRSIDRIVRELSTLTNLLGSYIELKAITQSLRSLVYYLYENKEELIVMDHSYLLLFEGLFNNLKNWYLALFVSGCVNINIFDASIQADIDIIKTMIQSVNEMSETSIELF